MEKAEETSRKKAVVTVDGLEGNCGGKGVVWVGTAGRKLWRSR